MMLVTKHREALRTFTEDFSATGQLAQGETLTSAAVFVSVGGTDVSASIAGTVTVSGSVVTYTLLAAASSAVQRPGLYELLIKAATSAGHVLTVRHDLTLTGDPALHSLVAASVTITGTALGAPGATSQLTATVKDANGNVVSVPVVWQTSNINATSVDVNGLLTFVAPGSATISAIAQGVVATVTSTVTDPGFTAATAKQVAYFNGTKWVPESLNAGDVDLTSAATATDANATATDYVVTLLAGVTRRLGLSSLAKWLNARRGIYSVVDFGADPTGVADSTTALQSCFDTAGPNSTIVIPAGTYLHTGLTYQSGQTYRGSAAGAQANAGQSLLKFTGAAGSSFAPKNAATTNTVNVGIDGVSFDGGTGADVVVDLTRASYGELRRVYAKGSKTGAVGYLFDAITTGQCYFNVIAGCKADMTNGTDMVFQNAANANTMIGGKLGNAQTGLTLTSNSASNTFVGVDFENNAVQHVNLDASSNKFFGCHMETAPIGFTITANGEQRHEYGTDMASSVTTQYSDSSPNAKEAVVHSGVKSGGPYWWKLGPFAMQGTFSSTVSIGTQWQLDPMPYSNTVAAYVDWYKNVNTSGTRRMRWYPGDGTTNDPAAQLDVGTGILYLKGGIAGDPNNVAAASTGLVRFAKRDTAMFRNEANSGDIQALIKNASDQVGIGDPTTGVLLANNGTAIKGMWVYAPSLTPASVAANTTATQTFTVTGLTTADKILSINPPSMLAGTGIVAYWVSGANTLSVQFSNNTSGALTPTAGTFTVVAVRS